MNNLEGKYALITGSSRGIGQQIAIGLAEKGCHIIVHGRTLNHCKDTLEMLEAYDIKTETVYGDLSDPEQISDLIEQVKNLGIHVDILYNNAAIMTAYHKNIWSHNWDEWVETFNVNLFAMYKLCAAFIPPMIERGYGRVVNLSSGIKHVPELAPYGASKAAVEKLTDDIASHIENTHVRINALDPGWLQTDMGGNEADHPVEMVLPGALAPVLIANDGPNGQLFTAIKN